jgi:hypothetical protein
MPSRLPSNPSLPSPEPKTPRRISTDQTAIDAQTVLEGVATPEQAAADGQPTAPDGEVATEDTAVQTTAPGTDAPSATESQQADGSAASSADLDPAAAAAAAAQSRCRSRQPRQHQSHPSPRKATGTKTVRIPPKRLLSSSWRTSTTLLDPKDGSPIHLDYRLQDGAGKLRLTRKDGSVCESGASARVQDDRLLVDSATEILCADGTSFGRPQIDCTPLADGKARCVGRYADGSTFPIDMQQQPQ